MAAVDLVQNRVPYGCETDSILPLFVIQTLDRIPIEVRLLTDNIILSKCVKSEEADISDINESLYQLQRLGHMSYHKKGTFCRHLKLLFCIKATIPKSREATLATNWSRKLFWKSCCRLLNHKHFDEFKVRRVSYKKNGAAK